MCSDNMTVSMPVSSATRAISTSRSGRLGSTMVQFSLRTRTMRGGRLMSAETGPTRGVSSPYALGHPTDRCQLLPLGVLGDLVAVDHRREAALGRDGELIKVEKAGSILETRGQLVVRLNPWRLGADHTQHERLPGWDESDRGDVTHAFGILPLDEEHVVIQLVEDPLRERLAGACA